MKRLLLIAVLFSLGACDGSRGMETRTFPLHRLSTEEAIALLTPYIRDGGTLSTPAGKSKGAQAPVRFVTVRERPERLQAIEDLLRKYDGHPNPVDLLLHIQVIEADGFTGRDSAIADIEQTLRRTFRYRGYRLAGEAHIQAREGSSFRRTLSGPGEREAYLLEGAVERVSTDRSSEQRVPISLELRGGRVELRSTVTGTLDKPTVLGQSTADGAVILVIRPSIARQ